MKKTKQKNNKIAQIHSEYLENRPQYIYAMKKKMLEHFVLCKSKSVIFLSQKILKAIFPPYKTKQKQQICCANNGT